MVNYLDHFLDVTFSALADSTRRAILARLARGESSVTELAEPFDMSLPAISKHLRVLQRAGLLAREKNGRVHRCSLAPEPLKQAAEWIARYRAFWEKQLDALADYLHESSKKEKIQWPKIQQSHRPRSRSEGRSQRPARKSSKLGRSRRS